MLVWLLIALVSLQSAPGRRRPPVDLRLQGYWQGRLTIAGETHDVTIHFSTRERTPVSLARHKLDGLYPLRSGSVGHTRDTFTARFPKHAFELSAALRRDGHTLDVTKTERGTTESAVFTRADASGGLKRPQTPRPPFPYDTYDDAIDTGNGVLGVTLTLPGGPGPFPGVVLLSGTGPQDRDNSHAGHRPFAVIADHLTRRGFAVLRFDDRGAGTSSGLFGELRTVQADAFDAIAALRYLREQPEVDRRRTGLIGHSEGGMVAPLAATMTSEVAFVVLLGAPATDAIRGSLLQHESIQRARGASDARLAFERGVREELYHAIVSETDIARVRERVATILRDATRAASPEDLGWLAELKSAIDALLRRHSTTFRQRLLEDPMTALRTIRVPALALFGSLDVQVPAEPNIALMRDALRASSPLSEVRSFDGLNHAFQTAPTGAVEEYWKIEQTIAPAVLDAIAAWLQRVTAK